VNPSFEVSQFDDSSLEPDGNGVGPIVGVQFSQNVFDVAFHSFFGDGELGGDLFIRIPTGNQPQNLNFPSGQGSIGGMLGEVRGYLGQNSLLPGMNQTNGFQQLLP
jgi:hypothetical protein